MGNSEEKSTVRLTNAGYRLMCKRIRAEMGKMNTLEMARFITEEFKAGYDVYEFDQDEIDMRLVIQPVRKSKPSVEVIFSKIKIQAPKSLSHLHPETC